jgi:hypothetical protein
MPGKKRFPVFLLFVLTCLILQDKTVFGQHQPFLDKKVSFAFTDTPLSNALRAIGNKTGVKFSYNPDLIQSSRRITMRFTNLPLREVLKKLLNDPTVSYQELGNQIVLFRGDPAKIPLESNQQLIIGKPKVVASRKIPDTVYVYRLDTLIIKHTDTVFRSISITRFDTVRIPDTIYIDNIRPALKVGYGIGTDSIQNPDGDQKKIENKGFYSGVYVELLPGFATYKSTVPEYRDYKALMEQANAGSLAKFSAGVLAAYDFKRVGILSGLGVTRLGEKFAYAYNVETGGFFKTDTVERYFTLPNGDTTYFYVTDSTWVPKDTRHYVYQNPNTYWYFDVPISLKCRFWQNRAAEIYGLGGINASFLISADALLINADNCNDVIRIKENELTPILFSWHLGLGTAIKLTPRSGIIAEATYRKQRTGIYKDLPLEKQFSLVGFKMSVYIRL